MKVWMVERHWDLDISILGLFSTKEKAMKAAEDEAKTERLFDDFKWESFNESKINIFRGTDVTFSLYVVEMEVE